MYFLLNKPDLAGGGLVDDSARCHLSSVTARLVFTAQVLNKGQLPLSSHLMNRRISTAKKSAAVASDWIDDQLAAQTDGVPMTVVV